MTAQDRKKNTEAFLKTVKVPFFDGLPCIEEEDEAKIRSGRDIAARIVVLIYLCLLGEEESCKEEIVRFLKSEDLWSHLAESEIELLEKESLTQKDKISISWKSEVVWMLLWVIGKVEIGLPKKECDVLNILDCLPDAFEPVGEFINSAVTREASIILDMSDLLYRLHWATRDAESHKRKIPAGLNPGVVYERHYAINWVTYFGDDWDEISADT